MFGEKKEAEKIAKQVAEEELKIMCKEFRVSKPFVIILSIVSIIGFLGIITRTLFLVNLDYYVESLWFLILGIGFIIESNPKRLFKKIDDTLNERNFSSITTLIVGALATIAGILTFLQIKSPAFEAVQGLISIIAIIFIIIQTWVIK